MQDLDSSMVQYQQGTSFPVVIWKVLVRTPPPSDSTDIDYTEFDLTERLMNEPNITDAADYRENLTYINEIGVKLNNEDKFLTNEAETGILDTDAPIEIFLEGYFDVEGGELFPIRKFGGWLDRSRMKPDAVKMSVEALAYSYFGKAENIDGLNITRRYMDDNGLRLYTAKLWIRDANITSKVLTKGVHTITTKFDGLPWAKLDDGDYVTLVFDDEATLSNADDSERVLVFYSGFDHAEERVSTVIVKEEGQYPETYYYYPPLSEIIKKCFKEIGVTDSYIQQYEIETFDDRRIISGSNRVDETFDSFIPVAIEFNGTDKFYISGANTGSPNKNQIWEYNRSTGAIRLIYETTINDNTKYKLVFDETEDVLLAFIDSVEGDDPGFIQKFVITGAGASNTTLLYDTQYDSVNPYYRFHYSKFLKKFIYLGTDGANKKMFELDLDGVQTPIVTDANFELNGCSFIYESGSTVVFYYIKNVAGTRKLYKRTYSGGWVESYVVDWFDQGDYNNWYGYKFLAESKVIITNFEETRILDISGATFTSDINPTDTKLYSPFESDGKVYMVSYNFIDDIQKIVSIQSDTLSDASDDIIPYDIIKHPVIYGFQNITTFVSTELAVLSRYPALMLRFSNKFTPFLAGEIDTSGTTIRGFLQELSNNFLGYVKVDAYRKGFFVERSSYNSGFTLEFKKDYNKERVGERVNNEKYDRIEISNGLVSDQYGELGINTNSKKLELKYIPDDFIIDYAKYFLDYYSTRRRIIKIKYPPTFYNYENLDSADLSDYGYGTGRIHKVSPKKTVCEFEIII